MEGKTTETRHIYMQAIKKRILFSKKVT